jgi:hypothetical protein
MGLGIRRCSQATFKGEVAAAHTSPRALPRPNLVPQAPLQAQRMAEIVESGEPCLVARLAAIVAIAGLMLFVFRDETRNKLSDVLPTIAQLCKVSSPETSAYQTNVATAWRPFGFVGR